ncbi:EF-hand domain-containing protein [Actinocorallia sp. A-T 12471]|uniref:EF-hand domain-containing protein n=1 Tax=Actinocorallia sp. A-T 12471 TaxID=3089813 RepID=UPI0029D3AF87|nr:EF-hand domain-containing protein [Actinocorallia sp. A-T 12471]MDX6743242.1 EF-hand domain-containing protein [Actinocorallia sp. A-T 12471]
MSTSELQDRKLDRAFDHLDVNRDGMVDREDLAGLGARFLIGFGEPPTSSPGRTLLESFDLVWAAVMSRLDLDADSRIGRDQFRRGMAEAFIVGPDYEPVLRPANQAVARICDADADGLIDPVAFRTMQTAYGTAEADIASAFGALDADGDGMLTVSELERAAREFYTGDDPRAGGNWLFGRI